MSDAREKPTATLLPQGKLLVTGGYSDANGFLASAELYDVGLGFSGAWQPKATAATMTKNYRLQLSGSRFQGISQASGGGSEDSSANYPIAQLRHIDSEETTFLLVDPERGWSDTGFFSLPARGFVSGPALITVFTNGIPSDAKYLIVPQ